jgi:hypothetical protein
MEGSIHIWVGHCSVKLWLIGLLVCRRGVEAEDAGFDPFSLVLFLELEGVSRCDMPSLWGSAYRNEEIALLCLVGLLAHEAMCVEGPKRGIAATYILEFHGRLALLGLPREHHEGFGAADSSHFRAVLV